MAVAEEITSPELVLVSPPELAALAREALPDYEREYEQWVEYVRSAVAADVPEPEPEPEPAPEHTSAPAERRFTVGAFAFTALTAVACAAPLVLLILFRT